MEKQKAQECIMRLFQRNNNEISELESELKVLKARVNRQNNFLSRYSENNFLVFIAEDLDFRLHMFLREIDLKKDPVYSRLHDLLETSKRRMSEQEDFYLQKIFGIDFSLVPKLQYPYFKKFTEDIVNLEFPQRLVSAEKYNRFIQYASESQLIAGELSLIRETDWFNLEHISIFSVDEKSEVYLPIKNELSQEAIKNCNNAGEFHSEVGKNYFIARDDGSEMSFPTKDFYFGSEGIVKNLLYRCYEKTPEWQKQRIVKVAVSLTPQEFFDNCKPLSLKLSNGKLEVEGAKK